MSGNPRLPVNRQAVPVRDSRYAPPKGAPRLNASRVVVLLLFLVFLLGAAGFLALAVAPGTSSSPRPSGLTGVASPSGTSGSSSSGEVTTPGPGDTPNPESTPTEPVASVDPGASATPAPTQAPTGSLVMPIVPVVGFWGTETGISMHALTDALKGASSSWPRVIVLQTDRGAIADALGIKLANSVEMGDLAAIRTAVKQGALGLMRATDLTPAVRALALDGKDLFGNDRIKRNGDWPLLATVTAPVDQAWDQSKTWTLVAGGDMFLDRGVRNTTLEKGKGVDYPFDGGTARVTGHYCCAPSSVQAIVPSYVRTGHKGIVRQLVKDADLAIANLENPIPDNPSWHLNGFIFGGEPRSLVGFVNAGIDWVTLANNHIYDYGPAGVDQSRQNLTKAGLPFGGAGKNIQQAGQISYLQTHGVKVAIIACVAVGKAAWAGTNKAGGLPCKNVYVLPRIAEARRNADMVIVFPHWGVEYNRNPLPSQRRLAGDWVGAGADLIIGSHPHVPGAIEDINGHVVIYSMGNFIFDQYWSTATMESIIPEMTFAGTRLVQLTLNPDIILDQAQPNLLDPATDDGKALMKAICRASTALDW
jgi:poly-gamma-glutamate capsule biosynthesis protein CapA/YwtB (metallophosphatase superfamily)